MTLRGGGGERVLAKGLAVVCGVNPGGGAGGGGRRVCAPGAWRGRASFGFFPFGVVRVPCAAPPVVYFRPPWGQGFHFAPLLVSSPPPLSLEWLDPYLTLEPRLQPEPRNHLYCDNYLTEMSDYQAFRHRYYMPSLRHLASLYSDTISLPWSYLLKSDIIPLIQSLSPTHYLASLPCVHLHLKILFVPHGGTEHRLWRPPLMLPPHRPLALCLLVLCSISASSPVSGLRPPLYYCLGPASSCASSFSPRQIVYVPSPMLSGDLPYPVQPAPTPQGPVIFHPEPYSSRPMSGLSPGTLGSVCPFPVDTHAFVPFCEFSTAISALDGDHAILGDADRRPSQPGRPCFCIGGPPHRKLPNLHASHRDPTDQRPDMIGHN
ncbi:unnamed protein product [Prunus armeniaca]|uniref:Uncharacterized protein n=1 Tax=Prunus armeniaca TaxID=36596 RepID=A0A6J5VZR6_PRUAR|nr:unnamed protein product [Prunus armeniaca]